MLDSGAYSAWRRGEEIALPEYIAYIQEHRALLNSYVALDVIPGAKGQLNRDQRSVEKSAVCSYANFQKMKEAGLDPIPVFHMGERFYWLERMMDEGETYIGISPYSRAKPIVLHRWLTMCFQHISKNIRTHLFGATDQRLLTHYPFFSADSTTWTIGAGYGKIPIPPQGTNNEPDYTRAPIWLFVTGKSRDTIGLELKQLGPITSRYVCTYLHKIGVTNLDCLLTSNEARSLTHVKYLIALERVLTIKRAFKVIYATNTHAHPQNNLLNCLGCSQRLISYYEVRKKKSDSLREYVTNGTIKS